MDCSTPGFTVHHQILELARIHIQEVGHAIQPSRHLSSPLLLPSVFPSIRVFSNDSIFHVRWPKHWSFQWILEASISGASVLPTDIQGRFSLGLTGWISLPSKGLSRVFSNTTVQKHQFFSAVIFVYIFKVYKSG